MAGLVLKVAQTVPCTVEVSATAEWAKGTFWACPDVGLIFYD